MLKHLSIKNYALINDLKVSFNSGFTCITGETGAGKSILLGGLSLVLGKRADLSVLQNKDVKCTIEAEFEIGNLGLHAFFKTYDLDYDTHTIIRREILPSGKSRAFINDTPVVLTTLTALGNRLIDVHSQHQTLQLADNDFQLKVIDALGDNSRLMENYTTALGTYKTTAKELQDLLAFQEQAAKEQDYNSFLLKELQEFPLEEGLQQTLETQYEELNNVETILESLAKGNQLLNNEQAGVLSLLLQLKQVSARLGTFGKQYETLNERVQSVAIEVDDIAQELQTVQEGIAVNPQLLEEVNNKLQTLYDLQKKHHVSDITALLEIRETLEQKVDATLNATSDIEAKESQLLMQKAKLEELATSIRKRRLAVIPSLKQKLQEQLRSLGMSSASFKIEINAAMDFKSNGKDDLLFHFAANKGSNYGNLKKVASGGELSRIMLTIKAILAQYEQLPTLMFDEIDTGVSGDISNRMGEIMQEMSASMQLFSITHLPQVASKGDHHFKVYKVEEAGSTHTKMKQLTQEERIVELAEMLGGKSLTDAAMAHAKQLLN